MEDALELGKKISRRNLLKIGGASVIGLKLGFGEKKTKAEKDEKLPSEFWGKLVNSDNPRDATRSVFFFAGPDNPDSKLINLTPGIEWTQENIPKIFDDMKDAGINSIDLSWWGKNEEYKKWAPTESSEEVTMQVFDEAEKRKMLVAPVIEVSPDFEFWKEFPQDTSKLEDRIQYLLENYGQKEAWEKMFDRNGEVRYVIKLIETIHGESTDSDKFANGFDVVANKMFKKTGLKIGFVIDPTPLPADGSFEGSSPDSLKKTKSILAINPYNIFSDGQTEEERIKNAQKILSFWHDSGIPLIVPLIVGFDDTHFRSPGQKYGYSNNWLVEISRLAREYQTAGVRFDNWNAVTEGSAVVPTEEKGAEYYEFAKNLLSEPEFNPDNNMHKLFMPQITRE